MDLEEGKLASIEPARAEGRCSRSTSLHPLARANCEACTQSLMAPSKQPAQPTERLEVPTLPPPSSRFVLPPPPSDLLNRLQAFLPQIRDANAQLDPSAADGAPLGDEAVALEEITDSSDDDSDNDDDDDSSSSSSDSDSDEEDNSDGPARARQEDAEAATASAPAATDDEGRGTLAHLMDISARPTVTRSKLIVVEEPAGEDKADSMEAD
ncbi:hypothetical protein DMC30DRAFT_88751 [Rhodotorula diobovata]|uniref:Uncharacterized protein n=1 Tax=Rhodotorula diobovata TaxID=5288 RepID=A0A5C5FLZ6_9BASI|nr:hypothetical protein DMC30DRAFT_88751 [Rhodotorula diobovata]